MTEAGELVNDLGFAVSSTSWALGVWDSPETAFDVDIRQVEARGLMTYADSVIENELPPSFWTGMLPQLNSPIGQIFGGMRKPSKRPKPRFSGAREFWLGRPNILMKMVGNSFS
jgi:hypothetical protein